MERAHADMCEPKINGRSWCGPSCFNLLSIFASILKKGLLLWHAKYSRMSLTLRGHFGGGLPSSSKASRSRCSAPCMTVKIHMSSVQECVFLCCVCACVGGCVLFVCACMCVCVCLSVSPSHHPPSLSLSLSLSFPTPPPLKLAHAPVTALMYLTSSEESFLNLGTELLSACTLIAYI